MVQSNGTTANDAVFLEDLRVKAEVQARLFGRRPPPPTLGRFRLQRKLGEGGMAAVYLAEDPELERQVAIKILSSRTTADQSRTERLKREAKLLARLSHPNIVHLYEVGRDRDVDFVAMEYVRGGTLDQWQAERTRGTPEILAMYRQAGEGLAAAHHQGIVHRDFKPENVLVSEHGRARVLDFGLAVSAGTLLARTNERRKIGDQERLTATGAVMGTPAYMAPEQYRGDAVDARADQFSFCVALFEALYGERPFEGTTAAALRRAVLRGQRRRVPYRRSTSRRVYRALCRGTAVEPRERWPTMSDLLEALGPRRSRRRGLGIATAAALIGATAIVGVAALTREPGSNSDSIPAPSGEPMPASTPKWSPRSQRLTNYSGQGVLSARLNEHADTLVFQADGKYHVRSLEGGVPRRLELGELSPTSVDFLPNDEGFLVVAKDGLWRVPHEGAPARAFDDSPVFTAIFVSPTGRVIGWIGKTLWVGDLETRRVLFDRTMPGEIEHASWKSDGSRLAVTLFDVTVGDVELVVVDLRQGDVQVVAKGADAGHAAMWAGDDLIVVDTAHVDGERTLRCFHASSGLDQAHWIESEPLNLPGYVSPLAVTPSGDLVGLVLERHRDVGLLDLRARAPSPLKLLGTPSKSSNWSPVWVDDERLLVKTDRFVQSLPIQYDLRDDETLAFEHFPAFSQWSAIDGGLVLVSESPGSETQRIDVTDSAFRSSRRLAVSLPESHPIIDIGCARSGACILIGQRDSEHRLFGLDVNAETLEPRGRCPGDVVCRPGAWSLSSDARELLLVDERRQRVSRYDATDAGWISDVFRIQNPSRIVQSAAEWNDGYLVTTMSALDRLDRPEPYAIEHVRPGRPIRRLWSSERGPWVIRPRLSPLGTRMAVTAMTFFSNVWRLEGGGQCPPPPAGSSPREDNPTPRPRAAIH